MTPSVFHQQVLRLEYLRNLAEGRMLYAEKTNQRRNAAKEAAKIAELNQEIEKLKQIIKCKQMN
jgi:hypothetical protein